jgi:endonuclease YncB( thermonuclease family)
MRPGKAISMNFVWRTLLALLAIHAAAAIAQPLKGVVTGVASGDALTLVDQSGQQQRFRLAGIAAPDTAQPAGMRAKTNLSALVFSREVEIVGNRIDRRGRLAGKVMVADTNCNDPACPKMNDAGLMQITSGMAWWDRDDAREQTPKDREDYEIAEFKARSQRLGLWSETNSQPARDGHRR